ncbi:MAG: GNAT family N-acetyltransferase [Nocardiopsaceae bacterium]|jgi:ribosomal protein S18 acetylase RimI-like enzyme|nr:GNAT family N-acetyltransferase [Nocardiopsaceae bacterium]
MTPPNRRDEPEHVQQECDFSQHPRLATEADMPAIRSLIAAAYDRYQDRMDKPPGPVLTDYTDAVVAGRVWLLGDPVTAVLVLIPEQESMLVENIAVSPAAQGSGIGRRLMEFAEQQALARGLRRMTLYTNEVMTENLAIYAKLGYRETARRAEGGYSRVFMAKELRG